MKKLTAGIFTVMLGLCAANNADAAVASKGYVDSFVGENGSITSEVATLKTTVADNKSAVDTAIAGVAKDLADYESANDAALAGVKTTAEKGVSDAAAVAQDLADYESANDARVLAVEGDVDTLQATVGDQATAISGINTKLESVATQEGLTDLTGDVTALQAQVGEGTVDSRIATAKQEAVDAAAGDATTKANQALADAKLYADGLDSAQKAAFESADSAINEKIGTVAEGKTVVEMIADAQTAATYDDTKVKEDIAANAQAIANEELARTNADNALDGRITSNTTAITTLNGDASTAGSVAKFIADAFTAADLSQYATTSAMETALTSYELKSNLKDLAYKDTVGTEQIDNGAVTTVKLADGAVDSTKLGKDAVTNNAVANGALSQDKINGLDTTLAAKLNIPTAANEKDGVYVLTATAIDGTATYYWESIER